MGRWYERNKLEGAVPEFSYFHKNGESTGGYFSLYLSLSDKSLRWIRANQILRVSTSLECNRTSLLHNQLYSCDFLQFTTQQPRFLGISTDKTDSISESETTLDLSILHAGLRNKEVCVEKSRTASSPTFAPAPLGSFASHVTGTCGNLASRLLVQYVFTRFSKGQNRRSLQSANTL